MYKRDTEGQTRSPEKAWKSRKNLYDRRFLQRRFSVGTWVWYYYPRRYVGRTPKYSKIYIMLVVEVVFTTNVRIPWNRISKSMLVHIDKLKLCKGFAI